MEQLDEKLEMSANNAVFLTVEQHRLILSVVSGWSASDKEERKVFHKEHGSKLYSWLKKYQVIVSSGSAVLIINDEPQSKQSSGDSAAAAPSAATGNTIAPETAADVVPVDQAMVVSHYGRVFDDLYVIHSAGGHCKAKTFEARIKLKHGSSIPRWIVRCLQIGSNAMSQSADWVSQSADCDVRRLNLQIETPDVAVCRLRCLSLQIVTALLPSTDMTWH